MITARTGIAHASVVGRGLDRVVGRRRPSRSRSITNSCGSSFSPGRRAVMPARPDARQEQPRGRHGAVPPRRSIPGLRLRRDRTSRHARPPRGRPTAGVARAAASRSPTPDRRARVACGRTARGGTPRSSVRSCRPLPRRGSDRTPAAGRGSTTASRRSAARRGRGGIDRVVLAPEDQHRHVDRSEARRLARRVRRRRARRAPA